MTFKNDNRGVSEVVGAILVFGVLIALLAILQTQAVPAANEEVEFNHNQEVQNDLAKLHETTTRVLNTGRTESTSVRLGTTYPTRLLFFNPRNPSGVVRSTEARTATIEAVGGNVVSPNTDVQERIDNIGTSGVIEFDVRSFEYRPNYNEYDEPPTTRYEYGILYDDFGDQQLLSNERSVVDTRQISLYATAGEFDRTSRGARPLEIEAAPAPPRKIPIRHDNPGSGNEIRMTLPTQLSQEQWDEIVAGEDNVVAATVDQSAEEVQIDLRSVDGAGNAIVYQLEVPRFSVDGSAPDPTPTYVTYADSDTKRIAAGRSAEVSAEVRDEYNNPIPDEDVTFELVDSNGNVVATKTATSDENGQATVEFASPPVGTNTVRIDAASVSGALGDSRISLEVGDPNAVGPVVMNSASIDRGADEITLSLQNTGGADIGVDQMQLQYASRSKPSDTILITSLNDPVAVPPAVQEGPQSIQSVTFLGTSDTSTISEASAPVSVSFGGNKLTAGGTPQDMTIQLDDISDNDAAILFSVRVFYEGGYSEVYSIHFAQ